MTARSREGGFAMLWACALVLVAGVLGATLLERDQAMRREAASDETSLLTFHAVEGALAQARHALARDPRYAGETLHVGGVEVRVRVERIDPLGWNVELRTPGRDGGLRVRLRARSGLPRVASRSAI